MLPRPETPCGRRNAQRMRVAGCNAYRATRTSHVAWCITCLATEPKSQCPIKPWPRFASYSRNHLCLGIQSTPVRVGAIDFVDRAIANNVAKNAAKKVSADAEAAPAL